MERSAVAAAGCRHDRSAVVYAADVILAEAIAAGLEAAALVRRTAATASVEAVVRFGEVPALIVMACADPGDIGDIVEALGHLRVSVPVLACRDAPDADAVLRDLVAGASGVLALSSGTPEFVAAARAVMGGGLVVPPALWPGLTCALARHAAQQAQAQDRLAAMTPRERQVLGLLARGHRQHEIAARLGVSTHTARTHVDSVRAKLQAGSQLQAAVEARRTLALASTPVVPVAARPA